MDAKRTIYLPIEIKNELFGHLFLAFIAIRGDIASY